MAHTVTRACARARARATAKGKGKEKARARDELLGGGQADDPGGDGARPDDRRLLAQVSACGENCAMHTSWASPHGDQEA